MSQMKEFLLNGEKYYIKQNINLLDLVAYFNYNNALLVLEYNKAICNKIYWKETFLQDQDQIEIVTIVGGG
uniref:Thiamine biosynthesis protein n=1 Tax=Psammodictyon constrictum TaxID=515483 RepID=UPI001EF9FC31|nr:Thiamine biosynthesis protein [Psammodictyon constrictum]ULD16437.1 Thiamine biosynthesis protein [Psammodictyon constrictum]